MCCCLLAADLVPAFCAEGTLTLETASDPQSVPSDQGTDAGAIVGGQAADAGGRAGEGRVGKLKLILWQVRAIGMIDGLGQGFPMAIFCAVAKNRPLKAIWVLKCGTHGYCQLCYGK